MIQVQIVLSVQILNLVAKEIFDRRTKYFKQETRGGGERGK